MKLAHVEVKLRNLAVITSNEASMSNFEITNGLYILSLPE